MGTKVRFPNYTALLPWVRIHKLSNYSLGLISFLYHS